MQKKAVSQKYTQKNRDQGTASRSKARQDKTRQGKARQDKECIHVCMHTCIYEFTNQSNRTKCNRIESIGTALHGWFRLGLEISLENSPKSKSKNSNICERLVKSTCLPHCLHAHMPYIYIHMFWRHICTLIFVRWARRSQLVVPMQQKYRIQAVDTTVTNPTRSAYACQKSG